MKLIKNLSWIILPLAMIVYFSACIEEEPARPQVVAGFTYTVTELGTVTFLNTSEKATKYAWDFGDGETSTEINPVKTYVPGTFFVSLKAFNDAGASDILKDTLTIIIKDKVSLPITFDNTNVDYDVTTFNGASFAIADNPSVSGSNNKAGKVGAITNSGVAFEGIFIDLETPINLATQKRIKMNFRASAPISVLMKLEEGTSGAVEVTATHGGTGWENLAFDFTSSASYSRLTLFVDGPGTTAGTFQIDDIEQTTTPAPTAPTTPAPTPPARAASNVISIFSNAYTNITGVDYNPNWGQATVTTTINIAGNATLKYAGLNYQGTDFSGNPQNASSMGFLHLDYWTANSTALNVYIISPGPVEKAKVLTVPTGGNWTSVDIPLSDFSPVNLANIIQFKFDGNGDIFLDNIYFYRTVVACTPEATENINPANGDINWTFKTNDAANTFEAFGNTSGAIVSNPLIAGLNTSCNVEKFTKTNGCETWSGLGKALATAIDFSTTTKKVFKMKVLAENQVSAVTLRLERLPFPDTEPSQERIANITQVGVWQELTFDFSNVTTGTFRSMVIYFERNTGCDGDVYYFDDIVQVAGSGGGGGGGGGTTNLAANGNFETGTDSGWLRFQNGGTSALDNTVNNGGSWSGKLATNGASNPAFKQERIGAGVVKAGDVVRVRFDHTGSVVQPGAVFNVLLFGEGASGASFTHVFNPAPSPTTGWTTFTGTFTIPGGTDVSQGLSFLIEAVCGGAVGCSVTANIDNVSVVLNP